MLNHHKLKCYSYSLDVAKRMPTILRLWPKGYSYLADQLKRAVSSITLNIAEGNGRNSPLERKRFFNISKGSASEVSAILDIALAYNLIKPTEYDNLQDLILQIIKILCKLK